MKAEKQFNKTDNPRFVWNIGAIQEVYSDMPEQGFDTVLWDRQEKLPVVTIHNNPGLKFNYGNIMCLETTSKGAACQPLTALEAWLNNMATGDLESENIPGTKRNRR